MALESRRHVISKDTYDQVMANHGIVTQDVMLNNFTDAQLYGYGVYGVHVREENGEYYICWEQGTSCD